MAGRQTRGRQRIPIRHIQNRDDLYATFSKRRLGLYKKASELSTLCGVDIGVIIFSPTDNPFSFFHPSMESMVERYRNPNQPASDYLRLIEAHSRVRIRQLNRRLDEVLDIKEQIKDREKRLEETDRSRVRGWWEQVLVESLDRDQVNEWIAWFENLRARVVTRIEEIKNGAGTSGSVATFQQQEQQQQQLLQQEVVPDVFPSSYDLAAGSSTTLYDLTGGVLGQADPFQGQYYNVPSQAQYQPNVSETGQFPSSYFQLPGPSSSSQDHQPGINEMGLQFPASYFQLPGPSSSTRVQDQIPAGHPMQVDDEGIVGHLPSYCFFPGLASQTQHDVLPGSQSMGYIPTPSYYLPGPSQDSSNVGGSGGAEFFGGQYGFLPQQDPDIGNGGGDGGGLGSSIYGDSGGGDSHQSHM